MQVQQQGQTILVQPASPQYVYVPYYDPMLVYGPWWWPAYRPVYWAPWPRPYVVRISHGFFFGNFDWHQHHVRVVHPTAYYYRPSLAVNRALAATPHRWQHEPQRREAPTRQRPVSVQQQIQAQPQVLRQERRAVVATERQQRRVELQQQRQQSRSQVNALPSVQVRPAAQVQPAVRAQPALRTQPQAQVRQEQRARMPEAGAPQQPRAARQEKRQERHELRQERRNERGQKGSERS